MNNIGLDVKRGQTNKGPVPLQSASKRNIGLLMTRERGAENIASLVTSLQEDTLKFGGYLDDSFGHIVARNLFKNALDAQPIVYGCRVVGSGSLQASITATIPLTVAVNLTVMAGQLGRVDKGTWGNDLSFRIYYKGAAQKNNWVLTVYYKGVLVETWAATTCAILQEDINSKSNFILVTFSGEPAIPTGTSTVIPGGNTGDGTISTISAGTPEVRATSATTVTVAGANGDTIALYHDGNLLANYTVQTADTVTLVATGLKDNCNLGTHGYTATNLLGVLTITAPVGTGATPNSSLVQIVKTGTVTATTVAFASGVTEVPAGTVAVVTGIGTDFVTDAAVGNALYTATGQYIGKIITVTDATHVTLSAIAEVPLSVQGYIIVPFGYVEDTLEGGVYVAPTEADFYPVTGSNPLGLACFDGVDVQIIANSEYHTTTMAVAMKNYCESRQDCIAVVNTPLNANDLALLAFSNALQTANENYCAGYNCWVKTSNGNDTPSDIWAPAIGCVLGAGYVRVPYMYGDYVHIPPGGVDSNFIDCTEIAPSTISQPQLNRLTRDLTLNSVVYQKGIGFFIITSRTFSTKSLFHSVHIIMQTNMYVKTLQQGMTWTLQKPNTPELKRQIFSTLYSYFRNEYDNSALERSVAFEVACNIFCDQSNNPTTQDRKELNADVEWIPTDCAEAVRIRLNRNDNVLLTQTVN